MKEGAAENECLLRTHGKHTHVHTTQIYDQVFYAVQIFTPPVTW